MNRRSSTWKNTRGFSLVELLVTVGIVSVLVAIIFSVTKSSRRSADNAAGLANIRTLTAGILQYTMDNGNMIPPVIQRMNPSGSVTLPWASIISEGGYVDDKGMALQAENGYYGSSWRKLYNPGTKRLCPNGFNGGGFGYNNTMASYGEIYDAKNLSTITKPAVTIALADSNADPKWNGGMGYFDWVICDADNFKSFSNSLMDGWALYSFFDGHAERLRAKDPQSPMSPPEGFGIRYFMRTDR